MSTFAVVLVASMGLSSRGPRPRQMKTTARLAAMDLTGGWPTGAR